MFVIMLQNFMGIRVYIIKLNANSVMETIKLISTVLAYLYLIEK